MIPESLKKIQVGDFISLRSDNGETTGAIVTKLNEDYIELLVSNDGIVMRELIFYDSMKYIFRIMGYAIPMHLIMDKQQIIKQFNIIKRYTKDDEHNNKVVLINHIIKYIREKYGVEVA